MTRAIWLLKRAGEIMRLAEGHWTVLETMSAADFLEFRSYLTGASGMQSHQFRELEVMCGLCETAGDAYRDRVEKAWPGLTALYPVTLRRAFFGHRKIGTLISRDLPRSMELVRTLHARRKPV